MALYGDLTYDSRVQRGGTHAGRAGYVDDDLVCLRERTRPRSHSRRRAASSSATVGRPSVPWRRIRSWRAANWPRRGPAAGGSPGCCSYVRGLRDWGRLAVGGLSPRGRLACARSHRPRGHRARDRAPASRWSTTRTICSRRREPPGSAACRRLLAPAGVRTPARCARLAGRHGQRARSPTFCGTLGRSRGSSSSTTARSAGTPPARAITPLPRALGWTRPKEPIVLYHGGLSATRGRETDARPSQPASRTPLWFSWATATSSDAEFLGRPTSPLAAARARAGPVPPDGAPRVGRDRGRRRDANPGRHRATTGSRPRTSCSNAWPQGRP